MTIEATFVEGKAAHVAYLDDKLEPTTRELATAFKLVFDDGSKIIFGRLAQDAPPPSA